MIMDITEQTLLYYDQNANRFMEDTIDVDFSAIREQFLNYVPKYGTILDLGCGSGRDSRAFLQQGYHVIAVDGSKELCKAASKYINQPVICSLFQEYVPEEQLDGIWACASLVHLNKADIIETVLKLSAFLRPEGCFYMSFKYGNSEGFRDGKYYTDFTEQGIQELLEQIPELNFQKLWTTHDARADNETKWLNILCIAKRKFNL